MTKFNFSIIAHVDHGKSTLADALLKHFGTRLSDDKNPSLDNMALEKERGITIKTQTVRLEKDNIILNLLDTPGHIDFAYEVSRALAACKGSLLLVDGSQGVESQTIGHLYKAIEHNHVIIPVINKIDLPLIDIEQIERQIYELIGDKIPCVHVSAKNSKGIDVLVENIIKYIPPETNVIHKDNSDNNLRCLVLDSWYDNYIGEQLLVYVEQGLIKVGNKIYTINNNTHKGVEVKKIQVFSPNLVETMAGETGDIILLSTFNRDIHNIVGDTISFNKNIEPIEGFSPIQHTVYCSMFPVDITFEAARDNMEKLNLNDPSFSFTIENIVGIGPSFRCGFLGLLHMEIIQERLIRDFNMEVNMTTPSVQYKITQDNKSFMSYSALDFPDSNRNCILEEPWVLCHIFAKQEFVGKIINLCIGKRGENKNIVYGNPAVLEFYLPLSEIILDFQDKIQNITNGYGSFYYEDSGFRKSDLLKFDILINNDPINLLSFVAHRDNGLNRGKKICEMLKDILPRQQFPQAIQCAIGTKVIARETISPYRKNVLAKLYGGDRTRKDKLLNKQKEGKKKMKEFGKIKIAHQDIIKIFKIS